MSDTYNEPADYVRDDAQAAAPSVASQPAIKARKQSPQTDVNQFWQRVRTKHRGDPSDWWSLTLFSLQPSILAK